MNLYIDRQNLINIFKEVKNPLQADAIRTMKRQLNVRFQFSKEEAQIDDELSMYLLGFTEGIEAHVSHTYQPNGYAPYELKANIHTTHTDKQGVFLLDAPENKIKLCQEKGGLMVYGTGDEFTLFEKLFLNRKDYDFHRDLKIGSVDLNKWPCLEPYSMPFTDLILVDNFICSDNSLIPNNLYKLLSNLHSGKKIVTNVVLFVEVKSFNPQPDFDTFRKDIRDNIHAVTGQYPNVTVVTWRQQKDNKHFAEHDRTIFTNYLRLKSGDTFNYFDSLGAVRTHGRELSLSSLAKRESFMLAGDLISYLNDYLAWCRTNNLGNIQGDEASNFLTF